MTMCLDRIGFGWWNTSLSPPRKANPATPDERSVAVRVVGMLTSELGIDVLGLGEVSEEDISALKDRALPRHYRVTRGGDSQRAAGPGTALVYNADKAEIVEFVPLEVAHGRTRTRLAQRVDMHLRGTTERLHLFIVHWPSRLWCAENSPRRDLLGVRLRDSVMSLAAGASVSCPTHLAQQDPTHLSR